MHGKLISFFLCIGSGKSYLAKVLRDLEVENGGNAPRIHSMDDYFMTEVEKVSSSSFSSIFPIFFIRAVDSVVHLSSYCLLLKGRGY